MVNKKIPADRLLFANISAMRTLVMMLAEKGILDADDFVERLQVTAATHRQSGDTNNLADAIHAISIHMQSSMG